MVVLVSVSRLVKSEAIGNTIAFIVSQQAWIVHLTSQI